MNLKNKLIHFILSWKPIRLLIIKKIIKFLNQNNFLTETLQIMTKQQSYDLLTRLITNDKIQQLELNNDIINELMKNKSFVENIAQNDKFLNSSQFVVIKKASIQNQKLKQATKNRNHIKSNLKISILICTPDIQSDFAKRCIESVKMHTKNYDYEILYFENGKFNDFNHAREINRALSASLGDYFITLDEDIEVTANWLESLLEHAKPNIGVVGCVNINSNPKLFGSVRSTGSWVDFEGEVHSNTESISQTINTPFVSSSCILINNRDIKFNEKFNKYYQEVDFCYRIWESGQQVVVTPHPIYHYVQGTLQMLGFTRSQRIEMGNKDKELFKKIWINTGRMQKLYSEIQPLVPFQITE